MADEQQAPQTEQEAHPSGGKMRMAMIALGMFIIVIAAQTVASLITTKLGITPAPGGDAPPVSVDTQDQEPEPATIDPPIYWPLKPALVVNFAGGSNSGFLQVELEVMARQQSVIDAVKDHTPALRDSLLICLAKQDGAVIFSPEGQAALRTEVLATLNDVLEPYTDEPRLEAVYFTSFVAQ